MLVALAIALTLLGLVGTIANFQHLLQLEKEGRKKEMSPYIAIYTISVISLSFGLVLFFNWYPHLPGINHN